ncbi:hypothetical protein [Hymenobacter sp. UYP22]|uniref:hypothetical protein n=1 Tax=Hymenobacter sp. UYP22 TaxID=3156348 RepID=UPI00339527D9
MSTQKGNTKENLTVLNALYEPMTHLFSDGKAKAEDYTFRQLLKRVRRERKAEPASEV